MKNKFLVSTFALSACILIFHACKRDEPGRGKKNSPTVALAPELPSTPYNYNTGGVPMITSTEVLDDNKATLGRVLFYDKVLSVNNMVSCASCHKQSLAFADNSAFSKGFSAKPSERNSMAIFNADRHDNYFWDSRENNLAEMVLKPVENHVEMGFDDAGAILRRIKEIPYYDNLFSNAYGVTPDNYTISQVKEALAHFIMSIKSANSKVDIEMAGGKALNASESRGHQIFEESGCITCHMKPTFSGKFTSYSHTSAATANIGLEMDYEDDGRVDVAGQEGRFKIPTLRNVELTAPYMHDGRFKTLEEVVEHYSSGVVMHKDLDHALVVTTQERINGQLTTVQKPKHLNLSDQQKKDLVAFLKALTDRSFTTDVKFSNPFKPVK